MEPQRQSGLFRTLDDNLLSQRENIINENLLVKSARAKSADIIGRLFIPRFIEGNPANAWKLVKTPGRTGDGFAVPAEKIVAEYRRILAEMRLMAQSMRSALAMPRIKALPAAWGMPGIAPVLC